MQKLSQMLEPRRAQPPVQSTIKAITPVNPAATQSATRPIVPPPAAATTATPKPVAQPMPTSTPKVTGIIDEISQSISKGTEALRGLGGMLSTLRQLPTSFGAEPPPADETSGYQVPDDLTPAVKRIGSTYIVYQ